MWSYIHLTTFFKCGLFMFRQHYLNVVESLTLSTTLESTTFTKMLLNRFNNIFYMLLKAFFVVVYLKILVVVDWTFDQVVHFLFPT
jgi:hypothetical protein